MADYGWKQVVSLPERQAAVNYAAKLRKQGYNVRVVDKGGWWSVQSNDIYRNPVQRMLG